MTPPWLRRAVASTFTALGYQLRRTRQLRWGDDAWHDQQKLLDASPVTAICDVGANVGDTVHRYRTLFPAATIDAFEPFPDVHRALAARFAGDARVRNHQCAVADRAGTRRLYVNDAHVTNSLLPLNPAAASWAGASAEHLDRTLDVPVVTLDEFCARRGLRHLDVLKLDIQGGEGQALEGAAGLLGSGAIRLVYLEILFAPLYRGQAGFCDVSRILQQHGYELFGLYNLEYAAEGLGWGDAIFRVRPS